MTFPYVFLFIFRDVFIVNTLDGKTNMLNAITGQLLWSHKINEGPLLSSTIGNVLVDNKGEVIKLFPSLNGHLYTFNGHTLQQTQFSAEKLIKNSLKFNDNVLLVGGNENKIVYIDFKTGELLHECGLKSCPPNYNLTDDMILFQKTSQSVRAINSISGEEEWHFTANDPQVLKVSRSACQDSMEAEQLHQLFTVRFKLIIQLGLITANVFHKSNGSMYNTWSFQFASPIVNMWRYRSGELVKLNIFDHSTINMDQINGGDARDLYYYIGVYQDQFYIQAPDNGEEMPALLEADKASDVNTAIMAINWKPSNKDSSSSGVQANELSEDYKIHTKPNFDVFDTKKAGFYVFYLNTTDKCQRDMSESNNQDSSEDNEFQIIERIVTNSLSYYWKEIAVICVSSWVFITLAFSYLKKWYFRAVAQPIAEPSTSGRTLTEVSLPAQSEVTPGAQQQQQPPQAISTEPQFYHSRYLQDFEQLKLLGKGGFGVVFEAKHKIDQSCYAVKRISLPTNAERREKFMREIRALSQLDHTGIVRYYNAWIEEPPIGWQEKQDKMHNLDITLESVLSGDDDEDDDEDKLTFDNLKSGTSLDISKYPPQPGGDDTQDSFIEFKDDSQDKESSNNESKKQMSKSKTNKQTISADFSRNLAHAKGFVYIQMQLCKKDTLKDWLLANKVRDKIEMLKIFVQITEAVDYVHANKLIHRDLKVCCCCQFQIFFSNLFLNFFSHRTYSLP